MSGQHRTTRSIFRIRTENDIVLLEQNSYEELVTATSIYDVFRTTAMLHGDRPALTVLKSADPHDVVTTRTHHELFREITQAANLLRGQSIRRGQVTAFLCRTHPQVPALIWGAQTAGIASCVNYLLAPAVISALLKAEDARVLVCPGPTLDTELWTRACEIVRHTDCIKSVLVMGGLPRETEDPRFHDLDALMKEQTQEQLVDIDEPGPNDIAALFHTGGTTGVPKLVPQTHLNQIHAAWSLAQLFDLSETDIGLNGFPLFHVGGTSTVGMSVLAAAGHMVVLSPSGFRDPGIVSNIWSLVERFRATMLGGVPTTIGSLSEVPVGEHDLSSLRFVMTGGSPLPKAVAERFEDQVGIPLLEQYGMTETVAALATTPLNGRIVRGSVGLRCPFSRIDIRMPADDGTWKQCSAGQVGAVTVRGPQVFGGYLDTRHDSGVFTPDGNLVTGDLGYLDHSGYLHLTGRERDLIIRSGHNIDPLAIEEIASSHPAVSVSAAVGMPDEYAGEIPTLFVSPLPGTELVMDEIRDYVHARIHEPPARPRHVFVIEEIPLTGVGKVFKPALRALAVRYKIDSLLHAIGMPLDVLDVSEADGPHGASRVRLTSRQAIDRTQVRQELDAMLARLPIRVEIVWAEHSSES